MNMCWVSKFIYSVFNIPFKSKKKKKKKRGNSHSDQEPLVTEKVYKTWPLLPGEKGAIFIWLVSSLPGTEGQASLDLPSSHSPG